MIATHAWSAALGTARTSWILAHLPDQAPKPKVEPGRTVSFGFRPDGWWEGRQVLPPDEGALAQRALESARNELSHQRHPDADVLLVLLAMFLATSATLRDDRLVHPLASWLGLLGESAQAM